MAEEQCYSVEAARELISDPRYTVEEFIGSGAMACVYKVSERGTPNIYALKLLREKYRERQQFLDIFQTEAIHMRDLQYPNIVRFYKFVQEESSAFILMDYVEGKPLTAEIQESRNGNGPMPLPKIVRIMAQIARAISYLHNEGYIHRDIKPGNILLAGKDESALLTDLGIAGALDVQDMYGGAGTPSYMPYEQQTHGTIDQTVDTYAFAVMLFEMFTGRKPFAPEKGLSFKEARAAIIELHNSAPIPSIVELRPELPEDLDEIFAQALAKKPAERYRDIMDFAQDVHEALLPYLPEELKDFNQIRPQEIVRSATPELIEVVSTKPRTVIFVGIAAITAIIALVFAGLYLNNRNPEATATIAPTSVPATQPIIENSPVPSETPIPATEAETEIPAVSATPFMAEIVPTVVLSDIEAIGSGFGETLSETIAGVLAYDAPFVPLRSQANFSVELVLAEASSGFGIVFDFQDEANYKRFRVADDAWYIEEISAGTVNVIAQAALESLPSRIALIRSDERLRFELDDNIIPYIGDMPSGGTALYFENPLELVSLTVGVIGEAGDSPAPLSPLSYLLENLTALQATGDASAIVQCPEFVLAYDRLEGHLSNELSGDFARRAQSLSAYIYSRCLVADGEVDFNDSYSDYLAWEDGIDALVNEIAPQ